MRCPASTSLPDWRSVWRQLGRSLTDRFLRSCHAGLPQMLQIKRDQGRALASLAAGSGEGDRISSFAHGSKAERRSGFCMSPSCHVLDRVDGHWIDRVKGTPKASAAQGGLTLRSALLAGRSAQRGPAHGAIRHITCPIICFGAAAVMSTADTLAQADSVQSQVVLSREGLCSCQLLRFA